MKRIHSRSAKPIIVIVVLVGTIVFLSQMSLRESYDVESGVKLRVKPSPIQGTGVFADETVKQGAVIIGGHHIEIGQTREPLRGVVQCVGEKGWKCV
jgi:hypothetical protein